MLRSMLLAALLIFVAMPSEARARPIDETPDWGWRHDVQKTHKIAGWKASKKGSRTIAAANKTNFFKSAYDSGEILLEEDCNGSTCVHRLIDSRRKIVCYSLNAKTFSCVRE